MGLAILKSFFTGLPVQIRHPRTQSGGFPPSSSAVVVRKPSPFAESIGDHLSGDLYTLTSSQFLHHPTHPTLPHPLLHRSPFPPTPLSPDDPRDPRYPPRSGSSALGQGTAHGVLHDYVLPQRPNPSSFRDRDATLREKREIPTLGDVGGTHVRTLSPILQGWKPEPLFVHTRKQAAMPELVFVPPQFVDLPPPPSTFALPDR